eukprot:TRINITY_DN644_c0_g1_i1.p1 TRINITY_DN644_c0_g1~~TRINITY_DN644_c0_g1_i1.p1  ORF type:complete len:250 (-),score=83.01 TRINITY_DN644_c0_g1_i1:358-1107(-)
MSDKIWLPLEANPAVMNKFLASLGLEDGFIFHDVFSTDEELLSFVPRPVLAVLLLFPISDASEEMRIKQQKKMEEEKIVIPPSVYFMDQTVGNACGTIGLLHAIGNNVDKLLIRKGSFFSNFFSKTDDLSQSERAEVLEKSEELEAVHDEVANEGDTEAPDRDARVLLHFICFVEKEGSLFELDGRKNGPICHGKTSADRLLEDSCAVIKTNFMDVDPESIEFTMVALGPGKNPFIGAEEKDEEKEESQ